MINFIYKFSDDILLIAGCVCVLIGLAQWSVIATWIVAGLMLTGFGLLIGKAKSNDHQ